MMEPSYEEHDSSQAAMNTITALMEILGPSDSLSISEKQLRALGWFVMGAAACSATSARPSISICSASVTDQKQPRCRANLMFFLAQLCAGLNLFTEQ